jgi:predicted dehydrogenase
MKTITLAQVGCGYWGPNLLRALKSVPHAKVKWLCDKKPGRLSWVRKNHSDVSATADLEQILGDPDIDAVAVATEPYTHHKIGCAVLNANKHLFMEKPLARSKKEALELVHLAKVRQKIIGVGHVYLYHPAIEKLRETFDRGSLGQPLYLELERVNPGPPKPKHDVIWDLAPHEISLALTFAGAAPRSVRAIGLKWDLKLFEAASIEIRFANDVFARVHASWRSCYKIRRLDAYCEKGSAFVHELSPIPLRLVYPSKDNRIGASKSFSGTFSYGQGRTETPSVKKIQPLEKECADFVSAIRERRKPRSDGALGVQVVQVLEAASRSAAAGGREIRLT